MTEQEYTTVILDAKTIAEADAIVARLREIEVDRVTRTSVVRRAVHALFLSVCPTDKPIDIPDGKAA